MDDFIIQHPQGGSGFLGARAAPGEQDGSSARSCGGGRQRYNRRKCQANAVTLFPSTNPPHHLVRLVPPPNLLPGRRDRVKEPH